MSKEPKSQRPVQESVKFLHCDPLRMEAAGYCETLPNFYQAKKSHIPGDSSVHTHHSEEPQISQSFRMFTGFILTEIKHLPFSQIQLPHSLYRSSEIKIYSQPARNSLRSSAQQLHNCNLSVKHKQWRWSWIRFTKNCFLFNFFFILGGF